MGSFQDLPDIKDAKKLKITLSQTREVGGYGPAKFNFFSTIG